MIIEVVEGAVDVIATEERGYRPEESFDVHETDIPLRNGERGLKIKLRLIQGPPRPHHQGQDDLLGVLVRILREYHVRR